MFAEEHYARFMRARVQLQPLTSGHPLYWDGIHPASEGSGLTPGIEPTVWMAVPVQEQGVGAGCTHPPMTTRSQGHLTCLTVSPPSWATEAFRMTFYLERRVLAGAQDALLPATGTLMWVVCEGQGAGSPPAWHPALLVRTAPATCHEAYVELVPHLPSDDPLYHHMELVLQVALAAEDLSEQLYAMSLADALAIHFLRRYGGCQPPTLAGPRGLSSAQLRRTLTYIQAHLAEDISLHTLATIAHMSPSYFTRLFKQATGETPHQYVVRCRIALAKHLLTETDLSLSAIGLQVGYADQSHFTALFRRHVATTPRAYRYAAQRA